MVQAKAKVMDLAVADTLKRKTAVTRTFKVFADRERSQANAAANTSSQKSVPGSGDLTQTTSCDVKNMKSCVENMEKTKAIQDTSVKTNVRRKALSDVSNAPNILLPKGVCDGSKPMKYKREAVACLKRVSSEPGARTSTVLQPKLGKLKEKQAQKTAEPCMSKRGIRDLQETSGDKGTTIKGPCRSKVPMNRRTQARSLALIRNSLPNLQRNKQAGCDVGNSESPNKRKGETTIRIKARCGHKLLPPVTNVQSRALRNKASYRHTIPVTKNDDKIDAYTSLTRKVSEIAVVTSNPQSTSQSEHVPEVDESSSVSTVSSENKKDTVPLPEITASTAAEGVLAEHPFSDTSHPCKNKLDIIGSKKAGRRRSYTSLLMATSKILGEHGEVQQEKLPSIDDRGNQLEVAEYVDEIYQYYWITEAQSPPLANYMSIQTDITSHMRSILVNWLIEVHQKFDLMHETLYLMVTLLDQYLSRVSIKKSDMQLVGLTALLLASKYEDFWHPRIKDLISISAECYTKEQMLLMERSFLKQLKFRLNVATPYVFMLRFLKAAQPDKKLEHLAFYLIELCLVQYDALNYKPSLLCASALYLARCTLKLSPAWTPLLIKHTRYEVPQMRECAEMILRFHKSDRTGKLKVTCEKYSSSDRGNVAALRQLENLRERNTPNTDQEGILYFQK